MVRNVSPKIINDKLLLGRCEWCQLPELDIPIIKAKIDTGAKTSSLHAFNIKKTFKQSVEYVSFDLHPIQGNDQTIVTCCAKVIDERPIMSSNGHIENRLVIKTQLKIADYEWSIEVTLSNRDPLRYRMLLGRESLADRVLIDPSINCNQRKIKKSEVFKRYGHTFGQ